MLSRRDPRRGFLVAAANLHARGEGVRPNMRLTEATALIETAIREHDLQEDIETLCNLAEQAQQFSPLVGLEQLDKKIWAGRTLLQPECLLLDISGIAGLFGGEEKLLQQVAEWLHSQNYFGCLAIAGSVGAAWAVANYSLRDSRSETRLAPEPPPVSKDQEPTSPNETSNVPLCRTEIIPPGYDPIAIDDLPLAALRLPSDVVDSLRRLGIRAIGQLGSLPRDGMASRLGSQLLDRWDSAIGEKNEAILSLHSSPDWCLQQTLEFPTPHRETLIELVKRLAEQLSRRLQERGQGALRVVCRLDLVEETPLILQLSLFRPTNDQDHLSLLIAGQLEQTLDRKQTAPLWRLSLQATLIAPMVWRQADLFSGDEAQNRNEVARLVDTLAARLGRKNVFQTSLRRESQPELAYATQPLTGKKKDGQEQSTVKKISSRISRKRAEPTLTDPLRRPTQLYKRPIPIEVQTGDSPQTPPANATPLDLSTAPKLPTRIHFQSTWHAIAQAVGPERLESGWWRGPSSRRDYYRIEAEHGNWWWIYHDLTSNEWFLHGTFD